MYMQVHVCVLSNRTLKICSQVNKLFLNHYRRDCYDDDWKSMAYFIATRETGFEMQLLENFDVELLIGQVSYKQRADIYNCCHKYEYVEREDPLVSRYDMIVTFIPRSSVKAIQNRRKIDRRRLEHAHFTFAALNISTWYPKPLTSCS